VKFSKKIQKIKILPVIFYGGGIVTKIVTTHGLTKFTCKTFKKTQFSKRRVLKIHERSERKNQKIYLQFFGMVSSYQKFNILIHL